MSARKLEAKTKATTATITATGTATTAAPAVAFVPPEGFSEFLEECKKITDPDVIKRAQEAMEHDLLSLR